VLDRSTAIQGSTSLLTKFVPDVGSSPRHGASGLAPVTWIRPLVTNGPADAVIATGNEARSETIAAIRRLFDLRMSVLRLL
jgi:hypothetical protein